MLSYKKKLLLCGLLSTFKVFAEPVMIENYTGQNYALEIDSEDSFRQVVQQLADCAQLIDNKETTNNELLLTVTSRPMSVKMNKNAQGFPHDFYLLPTDQNQKDITYVITTLADASLIKIKSLESSLKKAGNRLDQLHPLQFLILIFTNEQLKVGMMNLQGRAWVWKEFLKGIVNGLKEEAMLDNVMPYADVFANTVGVNPTLILPMMKAGKWENLIEILIKYVPREAPSKRYDQ